MNTICIDDDNIGIFHVFEMRIGINEFDHRILSLLKQQRETPENCFFFKICIYIQYDKNQVGVGCKRMDLWLGTNHSSFGANQLNLGMNRLNLGGYEATVGTNRLDTA